MTEFEFRSPTSKEDWNSYHRIREEVLWIGRGILGKYDPHHPDEHRDGNHPKILFVDGQPTGVIRIDLDLERGEAQFRRVAIAQNRQRNGFGTELMELAEKFAIEHGCNYFVADVSRDAVGFYEKIDYVLDTGNSSAISQNPRMVKRQRDQQVAAGNVR